MHWLCGEDEEGKMEACADRLLRFILKWFSVYMLHVHGLPHEPVTCLRYKQKTARALPRTHAVFTVHHQNTSDHLINLKK